MKKIKTFEISNSELGNGRRKFKIILHEIYPDSCIDIVNQVGTQYNENGITWIREYCEKNIDSIKGMSLRCEFLDIDGDRTEPCGHGETPTDGPLPAFEKAVMVGTFDVGYIEDIQTDDGIKTVCVGEGTIDGLCYKNFSERLKEEIENGIPPHCSVEILRTGNNENIVYKYGYKEFGRIPVEFEYSGCAILGVRAADQESKVVELMQKNEEQQTGEVKMEMNEEQIKNLINSAIKDVLNTDETIKKCKEECASAIAENEKKVAESNASVEKLTDELSACKEEYAKIVAEKNSMQEELDKCHEECATAKKREMIQELESAMADFSDDEKKCVSVEIDEFKESPVENGVQPIVDKIWSEIGKASKAAQIKAEQNSSNIKIEDIFSEINDAPDALDEKDIY